MNENGVPFVFGATLGPCVRVGSCQVSLNGRAVWPVVESHGRCGCGAVEMAGEIAWFERKADAERFAALLGPSAPSGQEKASKE